MTPIEIRHFHLFAGLGGGARGFNHGKARVGNMEARFRCIGGIDNDPAAMRDFQRMAGVRGTVLDMFDREQYRAFHDRDPGPDWREATPQDIQRAAGGERPHIVFLSAPCKGFSGLLSEAKSKTGKYQALNRLTLRGVWLMLEAWADDPPELVLFENATSGERALGEIQKLLTQEVVMSIFDYSDGKLIYRAGRRWTRPGQVAGCARKNGYVVVKVEQRMYYAHRLIYLLHHGVMPEEIDHINRNPADNRIENLRAVTRSENQWNRDAAGVYRRGSKWEASIQEFGAPRYLGHFDTKTDARAAYQSAKLSRVTRAKRTVLEQVVESNMLPALEGPKA